MSNDDDYDKDRIKVPIFEGDKSKFREWDIRWSAYARTKGLTPILSGKVTVPKHDKKNMTDEEEKLIELNYQGYARLLMKVNKFAFETVAHAKTSELPEGDLKKAYDDLKLVYQARNTAELVEIKTAFANCTLDDFKTNPEDWFCQLNTLAERQKQQGAAVTEEDIMAHILSKMPESYKDLRTSVTTLLNSDSTAVDLFKLKTLMRQHWEKYGGKGTKKAEEAFFAGTYKKQYKGQCKNCGKIGHKSAECRSKNKPNGYSHVTTDRVTREDNRKCFKCGKSGHLKANCPERQRNGSGNHGTTTNETSMFLGMIQELSSGSEIDTLPLKEEGWEHVPIKSNRWVMVSDIEDNVPEKKPSPPTSQKLCWADWCDESSEDEEEDDSYESKIEEVFMASSTEGGKKWLADTGSTCHCTNDAAYIPEKKKCSRGIIIGDSTTIAATHKGTAKITTSKGQHINLEDCLLVPELDRNIIALTKFSDNGHKIDISKDSIKVWDNEGDDFISFERDENLFYLTGKPRAVHEVAMTVQHFQSGTSIDYNTAHSILGHIGKANLEKTAKNIGWKLTGDLSTCESCALAKAIAKGVSKTAADIEQKPGDRMYVDISGPYPTTVGGSKYWVMAVDGHSRMKFSGFIARKSEIAKFVEGVFGKMKTYGHKVKYVRCDNAGENNKQLRLLAEQHEVIMEFTAPHTPQQNGVAERAITVVKEMALAMMIEAGINLEGRNKLWAEAINAATDISNLISTSVNERAALELLTGLKTDNVYKHLQPFGRVGYVTDRTKIKGKMATRSVKCLYVGQAKNHAGDVHRLYNPETNSTLFSRDVKWHDWHGNKGPTDNIEILRPDVKDTSEQVVVEDVLDDEDDADPPNPNVHVIPDEEQEAGRTTFDHGNEGTENDDEDFVEIRPTFTSVTTPSPSGQGRNNNIGTSTPMSSKLSRELKKLKVDMTSGPRRNKLVTFEVDQEEVQMAVDYVFSTLLASDPGTPRTYKEAMKSVEVEFWIGGIKVEFGNFNKRHVYKTTNRKKLRRNEKVLKCRWVFKRKVKEDGTIVYRARLVVKGYEQIPGVDYTESFAPTANDTTTRITVIYAMSKKNDGWVIDKIDIETAFLEAELDDEDRVFVEIPDGIEYFLNLSEDEIDEYKRNNVWLLMKAMYGLVQAPRKFYEKFRRVLTSDDVGMVVSEVDPCMYYKYDSNGELLAILIHHVDDAIIAGDKEAVRKIKEAIAKQMGVKDEGTLSKHLGVTYQFQGDGSMIMNQDDYVQDIIETYENLFGPTKNFPTPGYPGTTLAKADKENDKPVLLSEYRSFVGKILFAMKKTYPEIANAVRELAGHMDFPTEEHWKSAARLVGYLKHSAIHGLKYKVPTNNELIGYVDTDYATNKDTRKSTTGLLVDV